MFTSLSQFASPRRSGVWDVGAPLHRLARSRACGLAQSEAVGTALSTAWAPVPDVASSCCFLLRMGPGAWAQAAHGACSLLRTSASRSHCPAATRLAADQGGWVGVWWGWRTPGPGRPPEPPRPAPRRKSPEQTPSSRPLRKRVRRPGERSRETRRRRTRTSGTPRRWERCPSRLSGSGLHGRAADSGRLPNPLGRWGLLGPGRVPVGSLWAPVATTVVLSLACDKGRFFKVCGSVAFSASTRLCHSL